MSPYSIAGINQLSDQEKLAIFLPLIPEPIFERFSLSKDLVDENGNSLLLIEGKPGGQSLVLRMYHKFGFSDPILYSHMTDTLNGKIHVLLYIMNDPTSPRFAIDKLPDGSPTVFGTKVRNLDAELKAMQAGLLPGQIRKGLNLLSEAVASFELFIESLGHTMYFTEPLFYHNAIIFERYGFNYQSGKKRMEAINQRFTEDQEFIAQLGTTNPFRQPKAQEHIFYRSWAIHDGILSESFDHVTMYKTIGRKSDICTTPNISW